MINNTDDAMPARCQSCVPSIDCVFWLSDDDDRAYEDCCACPALARNIAIEVNDAGSTLRHHRINLNDRAAIEKVLFREPLTEFVQLALENGSRDDFVERVVECAKAHV